MRQTPSHHAKNTHRRLPAPVFFRRLVDTRFHEPIDTGEKPILFRSESRGPKADAGERQRRQVAKVSSRRSTFGLLCQCLRTEAGGTLPERIRRLTRTEWDHLLEESGRHAVTPLLYFCLTTAGCGPHIPRDITRRLRHVYLHSTATNARRYRNLSTILAALNEADVPVIALKGAHLAEIVYDGMIGLRPMCDVDLLFRKEDLERSQKVLSELDCFRPGKNTFNLDIHWNIEETDLFGDRGLAIAQLNIDIGGLWERAQPAVVSEVDSQVLSPEDLLIHLCMHVCFHHLLRSAGLRGLYDVRQTILHFRDQIQWNVVQSRSNQWGVSNVVLLTLLLAKELLNAEVPDQVIESLPPECRDGAVMDWAVCQLIDTEKESYESLSPFFWGTVSPGSSWERARQFCRFIRTPSIQIMSGQFPKPREAPKTLGNFRRRLKKKLWPHIQALWKILASDKHMARAYRQQQQKIAFRKWLTGRSGSMGTRIHKRGSRGPSKPFAISLLGTREQGTKRIPSRRPARRQPADVGADPRDAPTAIPCRRGDFQRY